MDGVIKVWEPREKKLMRGDYLLYARLSTKLGLTPACGIVSRTQVGVISSIFLIKNLRLRVLEERGWGYGLAQ